MTTEALMQAVQSLNAEDAFRPRFDAGQWRAFAQYLVRQELRSGDLLIRRGENDRTVYLIGQGMLQVFVPPTPGAAPTPSKIAILRPGALIGEPGFFTDGVRAASVEAMASSVVWAVRYPRFEELCARTPAVALEVLRAAGAVMALRMRANLMKQTPML